MAANNHYRYPALDANQIRIVEILPASNRDAPIHCKLSTESLENAPAYQALSYTWGTATETETIIIDSKDKFNVRGRVITVKKNLESVLRRLRRTDSSLQIWIDSICIDQQDTPERSLQAGKIKEVYQNAAAVYVWLGEAENDSTAAWTLIHDISNGNIESTISIIQDTSRLPQFQALSTLFRRPYWLRIWVVQEVTCGKTVTLHCGDESILLQKLESVCDTLKAALKLLRTSIFPNDSTMNNNILNGGPKILKLSHFTPEDAHQPSLFDLLKSHINKLSTLPEDKIYALVGISSSGQSFGYLDYTRSVRDTFIYTAKHIIQTSNKLDLICIRHNIDNPHNLPSWVPDWERRIGYPEHRVMGLHIRRPFFTASGNSLAVAEFLQNDTVLRARGLIIDKVGDMGAAFQLWGSDHADTKILKTLETFQTWWELYARTRQSNASGQEFSDTIYGGEWAAASEPLQQSDRFQAFCSLARSSLPPEKIAKNLPRRSRRLHAGTEIEYKAMISAASLRMHGKRFVMSEEKKLACLVPVDCEMGDMICILLGCCVPLIVRYSDVDERYQLIGEAFVHGVMKGEMMKHFQRGKFPQVDFVLK